MSLSSSYQNLKSKASPLSSSTSTVATTKTTSTSVNVEEDAEDHEIFDINDFTTASDWERFVVEIEELINEWKLNSSTNDNFEDDINFENGEWRVKEETIKFAEEITFTLAFFSLTSKNDSQDSSRKPTAITSELDEEKQQPQIRSVDDDFESTYLHDNETSTAAAAAAAAVQQQQQQQQQRIMVNLPPKSMADLLNKTNDFQTVSRDQKPTPELACWFGLCKFVVLKPTRANSFVDSESRARVILSSLSIAINNTGCSIPMFVQVDSPERHIYIGLCEGSALKTYFQIVHFKYTPVQYSFLPGLMEMYKSKLGTHLAANSSYSSLLVSVSIRFTYLIKRSSFIEWQVSGMSLPKTSPYEQKSFEEIELVDAKAESIYPDVKNFSLGCIQDCIDAICLSCVWSNLSEDIVVDNESFSDLNPQQSNDWSLVVHNLLHKCDLQLADCLYKFGDAMKRTISWTQLAGGVATTTPNSASSSSLTSLAATTTTTTTSGDETTAAAAAAAANEQLKKSTLDKLATTANSTGSRRLDRMVNLGSNIVERAYKMRTNLTDDSALPLDKAFLDFIMDYLFPDANLVRSSTKSPPDSTNSVNPKHSKSVSSSTSSSSMSSASFLKRLNLMKSSSSDNTGLLNKLATCLTLVTEVGQVRALAQLWREFVLELRYRYDSSIPISGLVSSTTTSASATAPTSTAAQSSSEPDSTAGAAAAAIVQPDLSRCLLHQKIQMLNCCIRKRLERKAYEMATASTKPPKEDDSEEEFFDCDEDENNSNSKNSGAPSHSLPPDGRLKKFGNITLINKPEEPLYIPITQESTPMTEDMLEQHASVLFNLGSSDDAALLRAKIQSASLLSDMQSFKAANPGCILEDFVRWYSPRDFIETEEKCDNDDADVKSVRKKYELSHRMRIAGNVWLDVWETARPVPVRKQKRLFDDTKEAENIFDWLNSLSIGKIVECILPIAYYSAIYTCYREAASLELNSITDPIFDTLVERAIKISRNNDIKRYQELIDHIKTIEQCVSLAKSLNRKFLFSSKTKLNNKNDNEVKEFIRNIIKSSVSHESCELKIPNGAHSNIGKIITKLCAATTTAYEGDDVKTRKKKKKKNPSLYDYKSLRVESVADDDVGAEDDDNDDEDVADDRVKSEQGQEDDDDDDDEESRTESDRFLPIDKPCQREYILRSSVPRPAPYSRQSPQRLYCLINSIEFRLAGAFTEDTMFF